MLRRPIYILLIVFAIWCLAIPSSSADSKPTSEQIAEAITNLGDENFDKRERATDFLWNAGTIAQSALEAAAKSDDREVSARAKSILEKLQLGVTQQTPPEIIGLIHKYQLGDPSIKSQVLQTLLEKNQVAVLLRLIGRETAADRELITRPICENARALAFGAMLRREFDNAEQPLLVLAQCDGSDAAIGNYAMLLLARGKLDSTIDKWSVDQEIQNDPNQVALLEKLCEIAVRPFKASHLPSSNSVAAQSTETDRTTADANKSSTTKTPPVPGIGLAPVPGIPPTLPPAAAEARANQLNSIILDLVRAAIEDAILEQRFDDAEKLLSAAARTDRAALSARNYAVFLLLRGTLNKTIESLKSTDRYKTAPSEAKMLARLLQVAGRLDEAIAIAQTTDDRDLKTDLYYRQKNWTALCSSELLPKPPEPLGMSPINPTSTARNQAQALGMQATLFRLANKPGKSEQALKALEEIAAREPAVQSLYVRSLMLNDRWDDAEQVFSDSNSRDHFDLLVSQQRYADALRAIGFKDLHFGAAAWLAQQAQTIKPAAPVPADQNGADRAPDDGWQKLFRFGVEVERLLCKLGELDQAHELLTALAKTPPGHNPQQLTFLIVVAQSTGVRDDALQLFAQPAAENRVSAYLLLRSGDSALITSDFWWNTFRTWFPQEDPLETLKSLQAVLNAYATDFPNSWTLAEMVEHAAGIAEKLPDNERLNALHDIAELCAHQGNTELTCKYFELESTTSAQYEAAKLAAQAANRPVPSPNIPYGLTVQRAQTALIRSGDVLAKANRWTEAAAVYQRAWEIDKHNAAALYLRGMALKKTGEAEHGRQVINMACMLPLANNRRRSLLASQLDAHDLKSLAQEQWELCLQLSSQENLSDFPSEPALEVIANARQASDPRKAGELYFRRAMALAQPLYALVTTQFVQAMHRIHTSQALAHMQSGHWDEAAAETELATKQFAANAGFVEQSLKLLQAAGRADEAEKLFAAQRDKFEIVLRDFPNSADQQNELARFLARTNRDLDTAKLHAETAVRLAPYRFYFLDGLAEIYFQQGNRQKASELEQQALKMSPGNPLLLRQLAKFSEPSTVPAHSDSAAHEK